MEKGRILFMDDDEVVAKIAKKMLNRLGYEAVIVRDGQEAILEYTSAIGTPAHFKAVIFDLVIPDGMGGEEALAQLQALDPGIKSIVSSGYLHAPITENFSDNGFNGAVPKPYNIKELESVLSTVIG